MLERVHRHFVRSLPVYLWGLVLMVWFGRVFTFAINLSDSLDGSVFLIEKGRQPVLGDYAAFLFAGDHPFPPGTRLLKQIAGQEGTQVTVSPRRGGGADYFVDGRFAGTAKPRAKAGFTLLPGPTGVIPASHFYMMAPHPDSFDSRYALLGWVPQEQIIGRAIRLF